MKEFIERVYIKKKHTFITFNLSDMVKFKVGPVNTLSAEAI